MRIAVFTDHFYPELGGIQDALVASARELAARGHVVAIFAPRAAARDYLKGGLTAAEPDMGPSVTVYRLPALPVPSATGQSRLVLPTGKRWRQLAAFKPDLIHSHSFLGVGLEALLAARRLGVVFVGTNHWSIGAFSMYAPIARDRLSHRLWRMLSRYYNHCDWVSVPSRATLGDMRAHGFSQPAGVISNPIDTVCFRPPAPRERETLKRRLGIGAGAVLYAGRFAKEKRIDVLLRALPALRRQVPEAELILAGHGNAREALSLLARELGVEANVRFVGTLDHAALAELCRAVDVFALASPSESQSMTLLQAMSAGLPAVVSLRGPFAEYITSETGFFVDPERPECFAEAISRLLCQPDLRLAMGARAAEATSPYGIRAVTDSWQEVYAQMKQGRAASISLDGGVSCD